MLDGRNSSVACSKVLLLNCYLVEHSPKIGYLYNWSFPKDSNWSIEVLQRYDICYMIWHMATRPYIVKENYAYTSLKTFGACLYCTTFLYQTSL